MQRRPRCGLLLRRDALLRGLMPRGLMLPLLALWLLGAGAQASGASKASSGEGNPDRSGAKVSQLLSAARTAISAHDLPTATRLATQSLREASTGEALFLLGQIAYEEHRLLDAQDLFRRYLAASDVEAATGSPDQLLAERVLAQPRPPAAQLNIIGDRGLLVQIDGRLLATLPLSLPLLLTPGDHKLTLERRGARVEDQIRLPPARLGEVRANLASRALVLSILPGILRIDEWPGLNEAEASRYSARVEQALVTQRLSPILIQDAHECGREPAPSACEDALRCQVDVARGCESDFILKTWLVRDAASPRRLSLRIAVVDVPIGEIAANDEVTCEGCTAEQLFETARSRLPALFEAGRNRSRGQLSIRSQPVGAALHIDGRKVGVTPYQATVFSGPHRIEFSLPGYSPEQDQIEVREGATAELDRTLTRPAPPALPLPPEPTGRAARPRIRIAAGAALIGAGLLLSGFGTAALAVDGSRVVTQCGDVTLGDRDCIFRTGSLGLGLLLPGVALTAAGTILWAIPGPRLRRGGGK